MIRHHSHHTEPPYPRCAASVSALSSSRSASESNGHRGMTATLPAYPGAGSLAIGTADRTSHRNQSAETERSTTTGRKAQGRSKGTRRRHPVIRCGTSPKGEGLLMASTRAALIVEQLDRVNRDEPNAKGRRFTDGIKSKRVGVPPTQGTAHCRARGNFFSSLKLRE